VLKNSSTDNLSLRKYISIYLLMLLTTPVTSIRLLSKSHGYMNSLTSKSIAKKQITILSKLPIFEASEYATHLLDSNQFVSIGDKTLQYYPHVGCKELN
jgi:hypothetical protein